MSGFRRERMAKYGSNTDIFDEVYYNTKNRGMYLMNTGQRNPIDQIDLL